MTIERKFLALLLLLFLAKGVLVTFSHVPFSGHDEVMHYAYLETLANEHRIPVIPDLAAWQAADKKGDSMQYDMAPDKLWPYCRFSTGDWNVGCGSISSPVRKVYWPPENANYLRAGDPATGRS